MRKILRPHGKKHYFVNMSLIFFVLLFASGFAVEPYPAKRPWLTGPLFTPSGEVITRGHFNLEPYVLATTKTGVYGDNWRIAKMPRFHQIATQMVLKVGLTERANFTIIGQSFTNETKGRRMSLFGDLPIGFDFQLIQGDIPLKLTILETFPIGKHQRLNLLNNGIDAVGFGSFSTKIGLTTSKLFTLSKNRFLSLCGSGGVVFFSPVPIHGLSTHGGDTSTKGTCYPGTLFGFFGSMEYTITKNWVFACDVLSQFSLKSRFKGHSVEDVGSPFSVQISLAPAIEYNFSKSVGAIIGPWFTIAGKNSIKFSSVVAAINFYY